MNATALTAVLNENYDDVKANIRDGRLIINGQYNNQHFNFDILFK